MGITDEINKIIAKHDSITNLYTSYFSNINQEIALTPRQEAVLMGVTLGDGYIQKISENSYRFKTNHSKKQKSQIDEIAKIFSNFKPGISKTTKSGKTGPSVVYTLSFSNPVLKKYHSMFYKPTKKVSSEILNKFTDESWAYYFFDNGSFHDSQASPYYRLHTEALGPEGTKLVQSYLSKKGFNSTIHKRSENGMSILNFDTASTPKISALLSRYASKDLKYKLMSKNSEQESCDKTTSKFSSFAHVSGVSKFGSFLPKSVKSDLDIQIPMPVELWILCTGINRDGEVTEEELEKSVDTWEGIDIIRHHDMKALGITEYGIHEEFGVTDSAKIKEKDGKKWLVADARITNRPVAYNMYLREMRGEPIEISAEYTWIKDSNGFNIKQKNIKGAVISLVDKGHIKGNTIKPKGGKTL